jgi:hypothetical protein
MLPSLISLRELVICRTGRPFRRTFESAIAISPERQQRDARQLARIRTGWPDDEGRASLATALVRNAPVIRHFPDKNVTRAACPESLRSIGPPLPASSGARSDHAALAREFEQHQRLDALQNLSANR